jgi:hypothetical protein
VSQHQQPHIFKKFQSPLLSQATALPSFSVPTSSASNPRRLIVLHFHDQVYFLHRYDVLAGYESGYGCRQLLELHFNAGMNGSGAKWCGM